MNKKLYVGNLDWNITDKELGLFFAAAGEVKMATVILDRDTGRSRGFGFVEMATEEQAKSALTLSNKELNGRSMVVSEARDKKRFESVLPSVTTGIPTNTVTSSIPLKPENEDGFIAIIKRFVEGAVDGEQVDFMVDDKRFIIARVGVNP